MLKKENISIQPVKEFSKGMWVYHEYDLYMIKENRDYGDFSVWELSNGFIVTSGDFENRVYPMSLEAKVISENFEYYDKKIRELSRSLNFPDIHRKIVSIWHKAMLSETIEERQNSFDEIKKFYEGIQYVVNEGMTVDGVKIMR